MPETDHWNSKLEKNTQCEKTYHSSFSTLQKLFKKINKKIIGHIKAGMGVLQLVCCIFPEQMLYLQIEANSSGYLLCIASFWLYSIFIYLVPYIHICLYYFLILCFHFYLVFLLFLPLFTFYNLQCLILFHYNLPVIIPDEKTIHSPRWKKTCHTNSC